MMTACLSSLKLAVALAALFFASAAWSGSYLQSDGFGGNPILEDTNKNLLRITHPEGYFGNGGVLNVNVCIAPTSQNQTEMAVSTENAIRTWNALIPTTGNIQSSGSAGLDFESVLLHELGHCIGLGHPNLASDSNLGSNFQEFTRSGNGDPNFYNLDPGADGIPGSSDDIRGDDTNLHWFRKSNNNPFTIANVIDKTTYSVILSDLPLGHNYAANADRDVGVLLGFADTEAVMQQGTPTQEAQRTLGHDDVATRRLAMSGLDGIQGTSDDYTLTLNFLGVSSSADCDIDIKIDPTESRLGFCAANFGNANTDSGAPVRDARLFDTAITFDGNANWHFNQVSNQTSVVDSDGDGLADALENNSCTSATDADSDDDGLDDGVEDANQNGAQHNGETDPCMPDSDDDGLQDGTELGITSAGADTDPAIFIPDSDPATTTLQLNDDSDDDGLEDGVEDANANGAVDVGESDPNDENSGPPVTTVPLMPLGFQLFAGLLLVLAVLIVGGLPASAVRLRETK